MFLSRFEDSRRKINPAKQREKEKKKTRKQQLVRHKGGTEKTRGGAALANRRFSFERPCDQLISHADVVI